MKNLFLIRLVDVQNKWGSAVVARLLCPVAIGDLAMESPAARYFQLNLSIMIARDVLSLVALSMHRHCSRILMFSVGILRGRAYRHRRHHGILRTSIGAIDK